MHGPHQVAQKSTSSTFPGRTLAQRFQPGGVDEIQLHGLLLDFRHLGGAAFFFRRPLDGTAESWSLRCSHGFVRKDGIDRVPCVLPFDEGNARAIVDAALIAQLARLIEDKDVRRGGRAILARCCLRFAVVEIREIEVAVLGPDFHFVERIGEIGVAHFVEADRFRIVGLDGNNGDAAVAIIGGELLDAVLVELSGGTVIAGEDDSKDLGGGEIGEMVSLAVDTRQSEIGR